MEPWQEKISKGMELIVEGCQENESWHNCGKCPFTEMCNCIIDNSELIVYTPDVWREQGYFDEKEDEKNGN